MIIAVDFDGTLFEDAFPYIGDPKWNVIEWCKRKRAEGNTLILWTCRADNDLEVALDACKQVGLEFDYINEETIETRKRFEGQTTRKIYADVYIDDRAFNVKCINEGGYFNA